MSNKDSAKNVIESYRRRQSMAQKAPLIFGVAALLLIISAGAIIFSLTGGPRATPTPTVTATSTATTAPTATQTPTVTNTPEPTLTATPTETVTPSGPFVYKVQEGDYLSSIAQKFKVSLITIYALNTNIDPNNPVIRVGQEIIIPSPNTTLPTATEIPQGYKGTIDYMVASGDSLLSIADKFNTTTDAIVTANKDKLKTVNDTIYAGWSIKVPVNLVTPRPTATIGTVYPTAVLPPTSTPTVGPSATPTTKP